MTKVLIGLIAAVVVLYGIFSLHNNLELML
jgi:hypothetical protein